MQGWFPGRSWDVCFGNLVTPVCRDTWGCPKTVLGCSLWNPPDTKSHLYTGMSLNCFWTSLVGSYGHQVTPACRNVPGLFWDISCRIFWRSSYINLQGCFRAVPDSPRHPIMSEQSWNVSNTCRQHWTSLKKLR